MVKGGEYQSRKGQAAVDIMVWLRGGLEEQ